jgi:hypothetical protein
MSLAIALTNKEGKHAGFVLLAGVAEDYRRTSGQWQGQCVFMALPTEPAMLSDAAYLELADRKQHGEHSLHVANDGAVVSLFASDESGECFYALIRGGGSGEWGTIHGGARIQSGHAIYAT